jgi:hypothetical protein
MEFREPDQVFEHQPLMIAFLNIMAEGSVL